MKRVTIGDHVIYFDRHSKRQNALVNCVHGDEKGYTMPDGQWHGPTINIVILATDEKKRDDYGRQVERETSICHRCGTTAPGFFWILPSEETV